jgi:nucleotide-binding universal stress UspA family protein
MRLLFAIDLREEYGPLMAQARRWTEALEATLDLVYVGVYSDLYRFVSDPHVRSLMAAEAEALREEHAQILQDLLREVAEPHRGDWHLPAGPPAQAIVEMEAPYDALMVATHGRTGVSHLWMGSVAERIIRTSTKPVIVLRLPAHPP